MKKRWWRHGHMTKLCLWAHNKITSANQKTRYIQNYIIYYWNNDWNILFLCSAFLFLLSYSPDVCFPLDVSYGDERFPSGCKNFIRAKPAKEDPYLPCKFYSVHGLLLSFYNTKQIFIMSTNSHQTYLISHISTKTLKTLQNNTLT